MLRPCSSTRRAPCSLCTFFPTSSCRRRTRYCTRRRGPLPAAHRSCASSASTYGTAIPACMTTRGVTSTFAPPSTSSTSTSYLCRKPGARPPSAASLSAWGRDLDLWAAYARANGSLRFLGFEEGLGILSRHRLEEVEKMNLAPRWPPWEMRAALEAVTVLPEGDRLRLANTHLSGRSPSARVGQASALAAALIESNTSLVVGDLNAGARAPTLRTLEAVPMQPLISERIDHILASPALLEGWEIRSTRALHLGQGALEEKISDHPALLVEIKRRSAAEEVLELDSGDI